MVEKQKQNGLCAVERGRSAETKTVENRLMWVACLLPWTRLTSGPIFPQKTILLPGPC
ncbi:hypothetical protein I79_021557 [Cricetulus griseus]|uniref:Uncharacterized protein n=1 Tax=Cricetulus griseus TaxID=10029 RepID=G3ICZ6_CRIGR|nr:hypothetical protein I79_021557 [Cricetulus griseus]